MEDFIILEEHADQGFVINRKLLLMPDIVKDILDLAFVNIVLYRLFVQPFADQKKSQEADENRKEETILIQGIIDVWFEEEDGIVLLDYKTDRVRNASQLKELYHAQLDYYAQALEQLLEKPVKEKIIYSFALKEEIIL